MVGGVLERAATDKEVSSGTSRSSRRGVPIFMAIFDRHAGKAEDETFCRKNSVVGAEDEEREACNSMIRNIQVDICITSFLQR